MSGVFLPSAHCCPYSSWGCSLCLGFVSQAISIRSVRLPNLRRLLSEGSVYFAVFRSTLVLLAPSLQLLPRKVKGYRGTSICKRR